MRQVSAAALRSMFAQETEEVYLLCVTLAHSSFTQPYRLVYNNEEVERGGVMFEPFAFALNLPAQTDGGEIPTVSMTIDNVDRSILLAIRTLPAGERVAATMEVVLASSPDTVEIGPIEYKILSINYDVSQITGTLGFDDDVLNVQFPSGSYTPSNSPGVFA